MLSFSRVNLLVVHPLVFSVVVWSSPCDISKSVSGCSRSQHCYSVVPNPLVWVGVQHVVAMAKVDDVLHFFKGSADELEEFWKKFQVVAKIQKWTTEKDKVANLPFFLSWVRSPCGANCRRWTTRARRKSKHASTNLFLCFLARPMRSLDEGGS